MVHGLVAQQVEQLGQMEQVEQADGLSKWTIREVEPAPASYIAAWASKLAEILKKLMNGVSGDLVAAELFTRVFGVPEGCNAVDSKWVSKWKGDIHGETERDTLRIV